MMKVLRRKELETNAVSIGDQISIKLNEFGEFTATAQKITNEGVLFLFDDIVAVRNMHGTYNDSATNNGGYEQSNLNEWVDSVLLKAFPQTMNIKELTIPTYGQLFGHDEYYYKHLHQDGDEQFPFMAIRKNRISDFRNSYGWYWLQNSTKEEVSLISYGIVDSNGFAHHDRSTKLYGIRPVLLL
jgi:hypothetical protein